MKTYTNGFEEAIIIHNGVDAFDTGVHTFHDDVSVTVAIPEDSQLHVAFRYGDTREDSPLPKGLRYLSKRDAENLLGISITFN